MKKFLAVLVVLTLLNGCSDGNVKVDTISFNGVAASACGDLIYTVAGNQAMIIKVVSTSANSTIAFANDAPPTSKILTIGTDANVTYRNYSGTVSESVLCTNPAPISPIATEEWIATSGTIEVTNAPIYSAPDSQTGRIAIINYRHAIVFHNIKFAKPDGTDQIYSEYVFGNYLTKPTVLPLSFPPDQIHLCPATNTLYNALNSGSEALYIQNFSPSLLATDNLGVPKQQLIGTTQNKLIYRLFSGPLVNGTNDSYFCGGAQTTPAVLEEWIGENGVAGVSGIIEVTTTTFGSGFEHTIHLKNVTFRKGNNTFYFGNDIPYGDLITN